MERRAGTRIKCAMGARKIDNASQAPMNPYGVGIVQPNVSASIPVGPLAPMMVKAAM